MRARVREITSKGCWESIHANKSRYMPRRMALSGAVDKDKVGEARAGTAKHVSKVQPRAEPEPREQFQGGVCGARPSVEPVAPPQRGRPLF